MYTAEGIIQMLVTLVILCFILGGIASKSKISSTKFMLLGIALIVFSNSILKGMIRYGIDDLISIIGLSFCIIGFFKGDK